MTNDNKQQKLSDSTEPAIAYSTCCVSGAVSKNGISLIHALTGEELSLKQ